MDKQKAIETFCSMAHSVQDEIFDSLEPADCFCGENKFSDGPHFQFSEKVMDFIRKAVYDAIAEEVANKEVTKEKE